MKKFTNEPPPGEKESDYARIQDGKNTKPAPSTADDRGVRQHQEKIEKNYQQQKK